MFEVLSAEFLKAKSMLATQNATAVISTIAVRQIAILDRLLRSPSPLRMDRRRWRSASRFFTSSKDSKAILHLLRRTRDRVNFGPSSSTLKGNRMFRFISVRIRTKKPPSRRFESGSDYRVGRGTSPSSVANSSRSFLPVQLRFWSKPCFPKNPKHIKYLNVY